MNGLDLFSGIGGLTKALEGYVEPVAYCENDRYCQSVLLSRMATGDLPLAPIWDDVTTLEGGAIPRPDIIYGGFPCQDISVAGRGAGLGGERSGLFFEVARLVGEIRPSFVFLENVAAITVRGSERVVGELCRLGYDTRWGILSAADVGANHRRERWWLLAHTDVQHGQRRWESQQPNGPVGPARAEPKGVCDALAYTDGQGRPWTGQQADGFEPSGENVAHAKGVGQRPGLRRKGTGKGGESVDRCGGKSEPEFRGMADELPQGLDPAGSLGGNLEEGEGINARQLHSRKPIVPLSEKAVRNVWEAIIARHPSSGWESEEQFTQEFSDAVRQLPHKASLANRQDPLEIARHYVSSVRQAIQAFGSMPDASVPIAKAWKSFSGEARAWIIGSVCNGPWFQEWPGVPRVAIGVKMRVDRLRGLGNAVVPAQAREAFERLMGIK